MSDYEASQDYVEFYSPGTFMSEMSTKKINSWDTEEAIRLMADVVERYNARPFGFRFITRARKAGELDSKVTKRSHMFFVNCDVLTADEILADNDPNFRTMQENVRSNEIKRIARTRSGWLGHYPMSDEDVAIEAPELAQPTPSANAG